MASTLQSSLECLSLEEISRLGEVLKDDKFRNLFIEYAEEINDSVKRKDYEKQLVEFERLHGIEVVFIHPEPGYVFTTTNDEGQEVFVNVCVNENVDCARCIRVSEGVNWNLPFLMAPFREEESDETDNKCLVYDVIFHKDTLYMAARNDRFKRMLNETALDGISSKFGVKLTKALHFPKLKYKGNPVPTLFRRPMNQRLDQLVDQIDHIEIGGSGDHAGTRKDELMTTMFKEESVNVSEELLPEHRVRYRHKFDLQDFAVNNSDPNLRPKELVLDVHLPLLDSARTISVSTTDQRQLLLEANGYRLSLKLSFPVNEDEGTAKFDTESRWLTVVLPVVPYKAPTNNNSYNRIEDFSSAHVCNFDELLSPSEPYQLAEFACNQTKDELALSFRLLNQETSCLDFRLCPCGGMFQAVYNQGGKWYGLCIASERSTFNFLLPVKERKSNMVIIKLAKQGILREFKYSATRTQEWYTHTFPTRDKLLDNLRHMQQDSLVIPLKSEQVKVENVDQETLTITIKPVKDRPAYLAKFRTCSESSTEELASPRGILKSVWRSTESCSEDSSSPNDSVDGIKKSVRFNEHIHKNIFRPNSSILGQKKKNQRRSQHKKKMKERKTSESSDCGLSSEGAEEDL